MAPRSARALVEGIPLYAPGDKILTPDAGFETYLPLLYRVRDSIPPLEAAVTDGDWAAVARRPTRKASEAVIMAELAGLDTSRSEAYTAPGLSVNSRRRRQAAAKGDDAEATSGAGARSCGPRGVGREVLALIPAEASLDLS